MERKGSRALGYIFRVFPINRQYIHGTFSRGPPPVGVTLPLMADTDRPQALVQSGLHAELMPQHVAFVMDGNSRWAQERGLTTEGYMASTRALEKIIELSGAWGIRAITVFVFSQENFRRPEARPLSHDLALAD
ncbi:dehydrodolichyl diphosphate synthase 2-like [Panicum miliaceum]|uniref:Dehydrodolichyl diphosphate synthase 2-like n=1 Tax=Panicum miliaceum TaxID=4540 RepID=A0A3L6T1U0_PANMI|nr:dehydrodolichyl diphosphate synthase 2-like [Panicum miliaceum]